MKMNKSQNTIFGPLLVGHRCGAQSIIMEASSASKLARLKAFYRALLRYLSICSLEIPRGKSTYSGAIAFWRERVGAAKGAGRISVYPRGLMSEHAVDAS